MRIIQLAIRTLCRFKMYTVINVVGLALSLACVILIFHYVQCELTVDSYTPNKSRIGFLARYDESRPITPAIIGGPFSDSDIELFSDFIWFSKDMVTVKKEAVDAAVIVADSNFLRVMDFPMLYGHASSLSDSPQNAIISESFARLLFGRANPIGEKVLYSTGDPLTITGVIIDQGAKRSMHFDLIVSMQLQEDWAGSFPMNVALIKAGADFVTINKRHDGYEPSPQGPTMNRYQLLPLEDVYLNSSIDTYNEMLLQGNKSYLQQLSWVGALILLVGIFNFMSLYTLILLRRGREFGLKKIFGNNSFGLFVQLYIENLFLTTLSLLVCWFLLEICSGFIASALNSVQGSNLMYDWVLSLLLLFFLPLLAVIFPFLKYRYATPVHSLTKMYIGGKSTVSRNLYLGVQYTVTFVLIVISLFFVKQLNSMLHQEVGYTTDYIIRASFQIYDRKTPTSQEEFSASLDRRKRSYAQIEAQMNASPLFSAWAFTVAPHHYQLDRLDENGVRFRRPNQPDYQPIAALPTSIANFNLLGFRPIAGRLWNDSIDRQGDAKLILNRKAMELFGITNLDTAEIQPQNPVWPRKDTAPYQVVGVIEDFYCGHLSKPMYPIAYYLYNGPPSDEIPLLAQIVRGKKQEAIAFLDQLHRETVDGTFNYTFATDEVRDLYKADRQVAILYSAFALMAILISSLGLFALSLFDIQQRYREIALRKVNGAMTKDILPLLLRKYALLLGASFLIAIPLSYWGICIYLEDFAYRAPISGWLFALAGIVVSLISFATLIYQVNKAAKMNPAEVMKSE